MAQGEPKKVQAHVPMDPELRERAGIAAAEEGLSFAAWVRQLIRRELKRENKKEQ